MEIGMGSAGAQMSVRSSVRLSDLFGGYRPRRVGWIWGASGSGFATIHMLLGPHFENMSKTIEIGFICKGIHSFAWPKIRKWIMEHMAC